MPTLHASLVKALASLSDGAEALAMVRNYIRSHEEIHEDAIPMFGDAMMEAYLQGVTDLVERLEPAPTKKEDRS